MTCRSRVRLLAIHRRVAAEAGTGSMEKIWLDKRPSRLSLLVKRTISHPLQSAGTGPHRPG